MVSATLQVVWRDIFHLMSYWGSHFPLYESAHQNHIGCTNKSGFPPVKPYITTSFHSDPIDDCRFFISRKSALKNMSYILQIIAIDGFLNDVISGELRLNHL